MKSSERVRQALSAAGATLKRATKHLVYELPNGQHVVLSGTPSDVRADRNALRDIRHASGTVPQPKPASAPRPKVRKPGRQPVEQWGLPREASPMASALRQTGLVEQQLRSQIGQLEGVLRERNARIKALEGLLVVRLWSAAERFIKRVRS